MLVDTSPIHSHTNIRLMWLQAPRASGVKEAKSITGQVNSRASRVKQVSSTSRDEEEEDTFALTQKTGGGGGGGGTCGGGDDGDGTLEVGDEILGLRDGYRAVVELVVGSSSSKSCICMYIYH